MKLLSIFRIEIAAQNFRFEAGKLLAKLTKVELFKILPKLSYSYYRKKFRYALLHQVVNSITFIDRLHDLL